MDYLEHSAGDLLAFASRPNRCALKLVAFYMEPRSHRNVGPQKKPLAVTLGAATAAEIRQLQELLSGQEPAAGGDYIAIPRLNQPYAAGSMAPLLGALTVGGASAGGVLLPRIDPENQPMKYLQLFFGLDEYFGAWILDELGTYSNDHWIEVLVRQQPKDLVLVELAFLNGSLRRPKLLQEIKAQFRNGLPPELGTRFDAAMTSTNQERVFLARQPILRAMRELLLFEGETQATLPLHPHAVAVMLAHAFATRLGGIEDSGPELWPTVSAAMAMELVQNYLFNQHEDLYARLDRYGRLWDEYGSRIERNQPRATPAEMLEEACGVGRADLFAVAFSVLSRAMGWKPGETYHVDPYGGIGMDRTLFESALGVFTTTQSELVADLKSADTDWAMLPFERKPVVRIGDAVVVLDQGYLEEIVTSGLYWIVLNHELTVHGKTAAHRWSQAYAEMLEALAEDMIATLAPPLLGPAAGKTFYTEEDLGRAYGAKKPKCDACVYFGDVLALFEIQKGNVSVDTRQQGRFEKFVSDTERLVLDKAIQLHAAAEQIIANEPALTGFPKTPGLKLLPIAVEGGTYPVNPLTDEYIRLRLLERGLLTDGRLLPLCIVDLGELEMLEGLADNVGASAAALLQQWKKSPGYRYALRNFLIEVYGRDGVLKFRPKRMAERLGPLTEDMVGRLKVQVQANA